MKIKLIKFIKECKNLVSLDLKGSLNQQFYDCLPNLCLAIKYLDIEEKKEINCDFLKNFGQLESLRINQHLSSQLIEEACFENDDERIMKEFGFKYRNKLVPYDVDRRRARDI